MVAIAVLAASGVVNWMKAKPCMPRGGLQGVSDQYALVS